MRTIKFTNAFKRDYKREKSGKSRQHVEKLDRELTEVVALLAADTVLHRRYADHPLTGEVLAEAQEGALVPIDHGDLMADPDQGACQR